ncbi:MAG: hypothetical protein AAF657_28265, partial [Acidobacteriota bacterium]
MRMSERHRHLFFLAGALLLATLVAALGGTSFQRNVASFQPIGFEAERQQNVWRVTAVADPETGIQPGDE